MQLFWYNTKFEHIMITWKSLICFLFLFNLKCNLFFQDQPQTPFNKILMKNSIKFNAIEICNAIENMKLLQTLKQANGQEYSLHWLQYQFWYKIFNDFLWWVTGRSLKCPISDENRSVIVEGFQMSLKNTFASSSAK